MVAKQPTIGNKCLLSLNLAKIHMVAKLRCGVCAYFVRLNLAKIHMVAKPQTDFIT